MMTTLMINTKDFYKDSEPSDVTIEFDRCDKRYHRFILRAKCPYLKELLNQDGFKNGDLTTISLKDDDFDELQAMFQYIYTLDYKNEGESYDCVFDLRLARLAKKYEMSDLENEAFNRFAKLAADEVTWFYITQMLERLNDFRTEWHPASARRKDLEQIIKSLQIKHSHKIMEVTRPGQVLGDDPENREKYLDYLTPIGGFHLADVRRCSRCGVQAIYEKGVLTWPVEFDEEDAWTIPMNCDPSCYDTAIVWTCWVRDRD